MSQSAGFNIEDLVNDPYFQQWILKPTEETESYWQSWIKQHPENEPILRQAVELVKLLNTTSYHLPENRKACMRERLLEATYSSENILPQQSSQRRKLLPFYQRIAASISIILLIGISLIWVNNLSNDNYVEIQFDQYKEYRLPDGSVVKLEANAQLRYPPTLANDTVREVWLQGQADFNISTLIKKNSKNQKVRFVVHVDELDIEVLGTQFLVESGLKNTKIYLKEGSVRLKVMDSLQVLMQPGDTVEFSSTQKELVKKYANTEASTTWLEDKLVFHNTPLREVASILRDKYEKDILIQNQSIAEETISAQLAGDDIELLFKYIALSGEIEVITDNEKIILK